MYSSIIIPVYERTEWLERCLRRLCCQKFTRSYEILVVDDGSPNGSMLESVVTAVQGQLSANIRYIRNVHAGPAAARNLGVKMSSGEILCFVDDDSLVDQAWLQEITHPFVATDRADLVSGRTLSLHSTGLSARLEHTVYSGKTWATCNIAYRRDVFEYLGGFDESFPEASWEDNDLGIRSRWAGYRHDYAANAIVYHPHEDTLEEYRRKCLMNGRGAAAFARKHFSRRPWWSLATPCIMARRLLYGVYPSVWLRKADSSAYLRYLWSWYSLRGFVASFGWGYGKN